MRRRNVRGTQPAASCRSSECRDSSYTCIRVKKDAKKGSGFSFADLAADKAGVMFASQVLTGKVCCARLSERFSVFDYMPSVDRLPEGMGWDEFVADYGRESSERYRLTIQDIVRRIQALPPYRPASGSSRH